MQETPREAPKCAKRNEIEGKSILTSKLPTMEPKKRKKRGKVLKTQNKKEKKSETLTNYLRYKE